MTNNKSLSIAILIVGVVGGFLGGYFFRNYQISKLRTGFANGVQGQRFNGARAGTPNSGMIGRGGTSGTVLSMDDKSITIKLIDGSSKIILFSESTKYVDTKEAAKNNIKVGIEVSAFGTPNSDGSVTAENIQLNPISFMPSPTPSAK